MPEPILTDLHRSPRQSYPFLWADYVELLALCSQDGRYARSNLEETDQEGGDLQRAGDDEDLAEADSAEEQDDAIAQRWDDIKPILNHRARSYAYWPFELRGNVLIRRFDPADAGHRIYAALLIAASFRLCHNTRANEVAAALEELTYLLLQNMLGASWKVKPFGAHQSIAAGYTGSLRAKLEQLAIDVHGKLMKEVDDYDPRNTGDGGIDVAAWADLGDKRGNIPVIFAQCGCSPTDWEEKQLSVTPAAVEAHITTDHPASAWYVSPQDLSHSDNKWNRAAHVCRVVLLDRRRLLALAQRHGLDAQVPAWPFVAEAAQLNYKLSA